MGYANRPVPTEEIQAMCDEQGFVGWIETSAKEDTHVSKAMRFLIEHILALHDDGYVAAPGGPLHGRVADLFNTDIRSILMVLC